MNEYIYVYIKYILNGLIYTLYIFYNLELKKSNHILTLTLTFNIPWDLSQYRAVVYETGFKKISNNAILLLSLNSL